MNNFFDFKETGALKLDKVLFESFYPILFTCRNAEGVLFLCVCCDDNKSMRKWLVTNVKPTTVIELLTNKITMRDAFIKDYGSKYSIIMDNASRQYIIEIDNNSDWNSNTSVDLPTPGEYIDAEEDEFLEEIQYYKYYIHKEIFLEEKFEWDHIQSICKIENPSSISQGSINNFVNDKIINNYWKTFTINKKITNKSNFIYKFDINYKYSEQSLKNILKDILSNKSKFTKQIKINKNEKTCNNKNLTIAA